MISPSPVISIGQEFLVSDKLKSTAQLKALLTRLVSQIDIAIGKQLSEVIQNRYFKQLEASWLSLQALTTLSISRRRIKLKLLNLSWSLVSRDLNSSFDLKQSALYRKLYSREYDTAGGTPFGIVMIDHKVVSSFGDTLDYDDLYTLQLLSELAEMTLCPVVLGVDEYFLGDEPRRQLHDHEKVERILSSHDFMPWQLLRAKPSSRFLYLAFPEYLLRPPYKQCLAGFLFNEQDEENKALWGNSAYLLISNVIREFDRISWFGFLRSYDEGALSGAIIHKWNSTYVKVDLYNESDDFWAKQGFVPLTSLYLSNHKGFFSNQSVWQPPNEASYQLGMLQTNLMACRFGHYIKAQIRNYIGRHLSIEDCSRSLERWLQNYVSELRSVEDSILARYPLKSCQVQIEKSPQDMTRYLCKITLQPRYQYEAMDAQVVLNTLVFNEEIGEIT